MPTNATKTTELFNVDTGSYTPVPGTKISVRHDMPTKRDHRTVVVVDLSAYSRIAEDYFERIDRFIHSFNHDQTIKADIVGAWGNRLLSWPRVMSLGAEALAAHETGEKLDVAGIQKWARMKKYSLVSIVCRPGR